MFDTIIFYCVRIKLMPYLLLGGSNFSVFWIQEGETIRINVKNKPSAGTGMLSAAGLSGGPSGTAKPKALSLSPPPVVGGKIRSPLPPPPNDPVAARMTSTSHGVGLKGTKENVRRSTDPLSDLSQLEVFLYFLSAICS